MTIEFTNNIKMELTDKQVDTIYHLAFTGFDMKDVPERLAEYGIAIHWVLNSAAPEDIEIITADGREFIFSNGRDKYPTLESVIKQLHKLKAFNHASFRERLSMA